MPRSTIALLLVVLALAACAPSSSPSLASPSTALAPTGAPSAAPSDMPAGSPAGSGSASGSGSTARGEVWLPDWSNGDVPDAVANRRPLPACGVERAPAPQPMEFVDRAVRLCFWNAHLARTEAEWVSVQTTMEGSPIATIYRLAADGSVEVFTDFTQDPFGGGKWTRATCSQVVRAEGDALVGVSGCEDRGPLE